MFVPYPVSSSYLQVSPDLPNSLHLSAYSPKIVLKTIFTAFICTFYNACMSDLSHRDQDGEANSMWGLTHGLYSFINMFLSLKWKHLLIWFRTSMAVLAAKWHCFVGFMLLWTTTSTSFSSSTTSSCLPIMK